MITLRSMRRLVGDVVVDMIGLVFKGTRVTRQCKAAALTV